MPNCFYAANAMIQDFNGITNSWNTMGMEGDGTYNWFDPIVYGPFKLVGDFSVSFEHCDANQFINTVTDMVSLDFGAIGERAASIGVDAFMNIGQYQNDALAALGWYVPPEIPACDIKDVTLASGLIDEAKQKKCL